MILYVNACVRAESRTDRLARCLLQLLGSYEEINLEKEELYPLHQASLDYRTKQIEKGDYSDTIFCRARQFAAADTIVISAPFWDYSFPAVLKTYLENIYVTGLVSKYGEDGSPVGLCRAKKLFYVTTAGGPYIPDFSFDYIRALAENAFGIPETELIKAEMLDIVGNDPEKILADAMHQLTEYYRR